MEGCALQSLCLFIMRVSTHSEALAAHHSACTLLQAPGFMTGVGCHAKSQPGPTVLRDVIEENMCCAHSVSWSSSVLRSASAEGASRALASLTKCAQRCSSMNPGNSIILHRAQQLPLLTHPDDLLDFVNLLQHSKTSQTVGSCLQLQHAVSCCAQLAHCRLAAGVLDGERPHLGYQLMICKG